MEESRKLREEFEMILNSKIKREENLIVDLFQFFFKKRRSKVLYRYRNFDEKDHNLNSLRNDRMYFSNPDSFNDPHDSLVFINSKKVDEENIKRLISEKTLIYYSSLSLLFINLIIGNMRRNGE